MVDDDSFLEHPHKCKLCGKDIDMKKIKNYAYEAQKQKYSPFSMEDPIIVKYYGNEIDIVCSAKCYEDYALP
jgi:hypothetical protein